MTNTTDPMTEAELRAAEERCKRATLGPWEALRDGNQYIGEQGECLVRASRVEGLPRAWNPHAIACFGKTASRHDVSRFTDEDADFIAAARTDLPRALREIRRLRNEVERLTSCLSHARDAANRLYQAARTLCEAAYNLDHFEIDDPEGAQLEPALGACQEALDPAEAEAAAREAARRDGLEGEVKDLRALLREARLRLAPLPRALTPEDHEPDTLPARIAAALGRKDH